MRFNYLNVTLKTAILATIVLLLGTGFAFGQQQVNVTAAPTSLTMPDGSSVPMWGYSCNVSGNPAAGGSQSCGPLDTNAGTGWSPIVITVPTGQDLTISLTNNLPSPVPTSLVIVGQLGGGLGTTGQSCTDAAGAKHGATCTQSPNHDNQPTTWPIANTGAVFTPPAQGPRVQSFGTEVATNGTATLTWTAPRVGTYLLESGTHPSIQGPMGLYGIVVVTGAPSGATPGTAYPGVSYNAEVPLLFSEIDPVQNNAVQSAVNTVGFSESATYGPFLNGPIVSINITNAGTGYTSAPSVTFSPFGASATAVVDTDPTSSTYGQVTGINIGNGGSYSSSPKVTIAPPSGCTTNCVQATAVAALQLNGNALAHCQSAQGPAAACYPPAVNYTPLYYLINGIAFDKTKNSNTLGGPSLFAVSPATGVSGSVLVRIVNAGLRMHVPSIVGSQYTSTLTTGPSTANGFGLIAEDGNKLPGVTRIQSEVFMAAGKTYDVMVDVPAASASALPVFDRQLSLSGNAYSRDNGMLGYISVNGSALPNSPALAGAVANADTYNSVIPGKALSISDPAKGVIANDFNVYGVGPTSPAAGHGTVSLNSNGTFSYVPDSSWSSGTTSDTFTYQANGNGPTALVTLNAAPIESGSFISCTNPSYTSATATTLSVKPPGILADCKDMAGYPLNVDLSTITAVTGVGTVGTLALDPNGDGGFNATQFGPGTYTFKFKAKNSQGTQSTSAATVTLVFPQPSNLAITVLDGQDRVTQIKDYRWIIEEDRTFYIDPTQRTNNGSNIVPIFGANFHTSYMPVVATGCTGTLSCESGQTQNGSPVVCDVGNGDCRPGNGETAVDPSQVGMCSTTQVTNCLDPRKRYYVSVLPGDAANPFNAGFGGAPDCSAAGVAAGSCGHTLGGAPISSAQVASNGSQAVTVLVERTPLQPAKLSVMVFEDDNPLNGEQDAGGGIDVLAPNEPGLGSFQITLFDDAGGSGDATGQPTYDMFNMPLSNSLAGTIDPVTGLDACPVAKQVTDNAVNGDGSQQGITGMIVTCPTYESDGVTLSPLAGQAVVANLYPGRYGVVATPAADRIARGEEWLQTNTLDGQKAHDSFLRVGEPAYFQEYGPAGYHVAIGFANPQIINGRLPEICAATTCNNTVTGKITTERMSRTPDERLYSSESRDSFAFTQCYVSIGDPDGADFAFTKCDQDGNFTLTGLPPGNWRVTSFDQWNDQLVDGLSVPVSLTGGQTVNMGDIAMQQWQANIYTRTFFDQNGNGIPDKDSQGNDAEQGLALVPTNIRFRDGSFSNFNNTDLNGYAGFNEVFPLFSWYVVETDTTRYKNTGTHVVYDAGGPADGTSACGRTGLPACGTSTAYNNMANTNEAVPLPASLRVPGSVYCSTADCIGSSLATVTNPNTNPPTVQPASASLTGSTGRIDGPFVTTQGWQGFSGQNSFLDFGKRPYVAGENGGIRGHVVYASTRPFDDPQLLLQLSWEPLVPNVTINLYKEGTAPDGSQSLILVDYTKTSSWDDWAQGFRSDGMPNMNCPGQSTSDLFYFTLYNQPNYLDVYNATFNGGTLHQIPNASQFKCYDGMHNWNQLQPAPYDGMYQFPSVTSTDPVTGKPLTTNCTMCTANPDRTDPYRYGTPMLPAGKYVVEVVVPPGYELVKEEDKNILIGDNYIAPVTQEFAGLGNIFILPDQAEVGAAYNSYNPQNPTQDLGRTTFATHESDTGSMETFWQCVGASRTVPDYISLFPQSQEVAPFAGATRSLCDRKEVTLADQTSALAKFYIFTSTHAAAHYTGVITDDFTSEFDPFSPQFGEKFSPPDLPVSIRDFNGNEIARTYADAWGSYNGLNYSTWEVNPPNPTGYGPTMMITCMNDAGPIPDPAHPGQMIPDPLYNPGYSQFCYEIPFMPGQTQYMDTPVVPNSAFSEGYNHPDCTYPDATPAISSVVGATGNSPFVAGPWVSAPGQTLIINSLPDQSVINYGYSGPSSTTNPFNLKTVNRHFGFGTRCTSPSAGSATCNTMSSVTIGGKTASITTWSDNQITVQVPSGVPACAIRQQTQFGGSAALCGELVITAGNGKQSVDTVTVTIGGKQPTVLTAGQTIQSAIDAAAPGDMIIVPPGNYREMLLMWKPVRLQGVGAASSVIDASTHPAGKLDPWRRSVNCLFGLALNGQPNTGTFDPSGAYSCPTGSASTLPNLQMGPNGNNWAYFTGNSNNPQVDRLPLEGILGWDTTVNGNLAEMLQEPSLMGAYEGAGITVLAKGVVIPQGADAFGTGAEAAFPAGTLLLANVTNVSVDHCSDPVNPYTSNFQCNPSSIDGLTVTDSSQGGGGIFAHGWTHNLQIANNRVADNTGTLSGGITIGQGEFPDAYLAGTTASDPGSCQTSIIPNLQLPYCFQTHVNVHHNAVTMNSSIGDELFSGTPAGAGGITFNTGSDYYAMTQNWVCGNLSSGDGGGVAHLGFTWNGDIDHNTIIFNQSTNPTIPTNGGGIVAMGAAPDGQNLQAGALGECGAVSDVDCAPGLSDGTGPHLVINANLIQGNAAESGSGGGIRLQAVNGTEIGNLAVLGTAPGVLECATPATCIWNSVSVTNNIISNNVAGWDGGGISLQDALAVNIINNTIVSNDSTASSGVLTNTLGAPIASVPPPGSNLTTSSTSSAPQVAGVVTMAHTPNLIASLSGLTVSCPPGHPNCQSVSYPVLFNNIIWQNRSFFISVGSYSPSYQQNVVTMNPTLNQSFTGACPSGASYWDIGVRGDTGPTNHGGGFTLNPLYSVMSSTTGYSSTNSSSNPLLDSQYCNGSRVPPENGGLGYQVPPGISDATVPNPIFNLLPSATVDEGNNWINISWGPLALTNPASQGTPGNWGSGPALGNFSLQPGSPAVDHIPCNVSTSPCSNLIEAAAALGFGGAPTTDFFGNPRPDTGNTIDVGAIEFKSGGANPFPVVSPTALAFGNGAVGFTSATQNLTLANTGTNGAVSGINIVVSAPFLRVTPTTGTACSTTAGFSLPQGQSCTIGVAFRPTAAQSYVGSVTITASNAVVTGSPVTLTGTGVAAVVTPASLNFGNVAVNTISNPTAPQLTLQTSVALTNVSLNFSAPFSRATGSGIGTCSTAASFSLAAGGSCTIGVRFSPTAVSPVSGALTINATGASITNNPVALSGTGYQANVTPTSLNFGNQAINTTSATQNLTLQAGVALGGVNLSFSNPAFARSTSAPGSCGSAPFSLAAGASCSIGITFRPTALGPQTRTLTISATTPAGATVTGSPVSLSGTGTLGTVPLLDNFNRATSSSLGPGPNWQQVSTAPVGVPIHVQDLQGNSASSGVAFCDNTATPPACGMNPIAAAPIGAVENASRTVATITTKTAHGLAVGATITITGVTNNRFNGSFTVASVPSPTTFTVANAGTTAPLANATSGGGLVSPTNTGGAAYWSAGPAFGARQVAQFQFKSLTTDGSSLVLKSTGGTTAAPTNFIQVQYANGAINVSTTTNSGSTYTTAGTVIVYGAGFNLGDTMTATVDGAGLVTVWQNSNYLGSVQLPINPLWTTGGGRIGMQLSPATMVDNFSGGVF